MYQGKRQRGKIVFHRIIGERRYPKHSKLVPQGLQHSYSWNPFWEFQRYKAHRSVSRMRVDIEMAQKTVGLQRKFIPKRPSFRRALGKWNCYIKARSNLICRVLLSMKRWSKNRIDDDQILKTRILKLSQFCLLTIVSRLREWKLQ